MSVAELSPWRPGVRRLEPARARTGVLAAACLLPALAMSLAAASSGPGGQALAAQAGAPAPFGVFLDLRWLLVFTRSWPEVAFWTAVAVTARSLLTAVQTWAAWPAGESAPPFRRLLALAASSTVVSVVLLAPLAAIQFGMAIASISYLYLGAVPAVWALAVLLHPSVTRNWLTASPTVRSVGWIVVTIGLLMLAGAAVLLVPAWARIPVTLGAAALEPLLWRRVIGALVRRPARRLPVAPVGVVALAAALVVGVTLSVGGNNRPGPAGLGPVPHGRGIPVLEVSGFGDGWYGKQSLHLGPGFTVARFSYRGVGPGGRPRYYPVTATYQSLPHLVALLRAQVALLHRRTGRPVVIVAESEGELLAKSYLLSTPHPPVRALVTASPLVDPVSVYFPPPGRAGYGVAAAWLMAGDSAALRALTPLQLPIQTALFRSALTHGPALRAALTCQIPGVEQVVLFPLADAVSTAYKGTGHLRIVSIPAFHGGLLDMPVVQQDLRSYLTTGRLPSTSTLNGVASAIQVLATAWDVPTLSAGLNPQWRTLPTTRDQCGTVARRLTGWLG